MLRLTKHTNPMTAPISVGAAILALLAAQGRAAFADIDIAVERICGHVSQRNIHEVLLLLYAVGALDYADEIDSFVPRERLVGRP